MLNMKLGYCSNPKKNCLKILISGFFTLLKNQVFIFESIHNSFGLVTYIYPLNLIKSL